jgi:hypothetical protein
MKRIISSIPMLVLLTACMGSAAEVRTDSNHSADFSQYKMKGSNHDHG